MRNWVLALAAVFVAFALFGCIGGGGTVQPQQNNSNPGTVIKRTIVSPVTITSNLETIVSGSNASPVNATNSTTNMSYFYTPNAPLFIYFINVSVITDVSPNASNEHQGEAILVKKGDADILIDTGPAAAGARLVRFLQEKGVDDIELLVSTHGRTENYGAMRYVLENFQVENFMWSGYDNADPDYVSAVEFAKGRSKANMTAQYLQNISINGISLLVINPLDAKDRFSNVDNDGIAFIVKDRNFSIMLTGDLTYGPQTKIADTKNFSPHVTVLQIPDNGLGFGTNNIDLFLMKVAPENAIITGSAFDPAGERKTIFEKLRLRKIPYYTNFRNATSGLATVPVKITYDGTDYLIGYDSK
jgi:hypothetical protein